MHGAYPVANPSRPANHLVEISVVELQLVKFCGDINIIYHYKEKLRGIDIQGAAKADERSPASASASASVEI